jgi:hypothetical protein
MQTLRTSASDLDALRYFMADDEGELADLLARLRREAPPTESMLAGTALHTALENCVIGDHAELSADGYTFELRCDGEIDLPEIRELKATRDYVVDGCLITLVGKVDGLHGRRVDDHKFTARYDAERFMASMQWRVYLEIFGADEFLWNVFEGRASTDDPKRYTIYALHRLHMHRYPGIGDDVERALGRFLEFARVHLPERIIPEAA